jgi:hypothetical protein
MMKKWKICLKRGERGGRGRERRGIRGGGKAKGKKRRGRERK